MDKNSRGQHVVDYPTISTFGIGDGAVPAAVQGYVQAEHYGIYPTFQTLLRIAGLPVVTGNTTGASFGSRKLFQLPQGRINFQSCNAYFSKITFNTAAGVDGDIGGGGSGDYSIGSTATADATLSGTDVDLLPSSAMLDPFVAGVGSSAAWTTLAAAAIFSGITTPLSLNLNVIIDDADVADAAAADSVFFTGYVRFTWTNFGDDLTDV